MNIVRLVCDITSTNNRNQSPTTTIGTKETISFSKATTDTGKTRGSVRKTSYKKHPQRKEKRKEKEQQKETDRLIDRMAMARDGGTEIEDGSSAAEAHELVRDHLYFE